MWTRNAYIPHVITASAMLVFGVLHGTIQADSALDIDVHDTYYVVSLFHVYLFLAMLGVIYSAGYSIMKWFKMPLTKWLSLLHFSIFMLLIGSFFLLIFGVDDQPRRYYDSDPMLNIAPVITIITFPLSTLAFLANIIFSLFHQKEKTRP